MPCRCNLATARLTTGEPQDRAGVEEDAEPPWARRGRPGGEGAEQNVEGADDGIAVAGCAGELAVAPSTVAMARTCPVRTSATIAIAPLAFAFVTSWVSTRSV